MKLLKLSKEHDRSKFSCGESSLDQYLRKQAGQDERRDLSTCYVLVDNEDLVKGFFTLSNTVILLDQIAADPPRGVRQRMGAYPELPAILLGRLAIDLSLRSTGSGAELLREALRICLQQSEQIAAAAIVTDPLNERAAAFYKGYGFESVLKTDRLLLLMDTLRKAGPSRV